MIYMSRFSDKTKYTLVINDNSEAEIVDIKHIPAEMFYAKIDTLFPYQTMYVVGSLDLNVNGLGAIRDNIHEVRNRLVLNVMNEFFKGVNNKDFSFIYEYKLKIKIHNFKIESLQNVYIIPQEILANVLLKEL